MPDEIVAAIAAEETERQEDAGETAVELARIEQENVETRAAADVEIVEAQAGAAVEIAEAQAQGNEEWRAEAAAIRLQLSDLAQGQASMAEAIAALVTVQTVPLIPTPPNLPSEEGAALEEAAEEAPPEPAPPVAEEKRRVRRLM